MPVSGNMCYEVLGRWHYGRKYKFLVRWVPPKKVNYLQRLKRNYCSKLFNSSWSNKLLILFILFRSEKHLPRWFCISECQGVVIKYWTSSSIPPQMMIRYSCRCWFMGRNRNKNLVVSSLTVQWPTRSSSRQGKVQ